MKVLADNWTKADEEVKELDKMLENVRMVRKACIYVLIFNMNVIYNWKPETH